MRPFIPVILVILIFSCIIPAFADDANGTALPGDLNSSPGSGNVAALSGWADTFTGTTSALSVGTPDTDQESPAIWEDRVVWMDRSSGNSDIRFYNITSGEEKQITDNPSSELSPDIFGDKIVWEDYRDGNYDIWMYDLESGLESQVTSDPADQKEPCIWGDVIVWTDFRGVSPQIFMYDIQAQMESQVSSGDYAKNPVVWEDTIAWADWRNENYDIYILDLSSGTGEEQISSDPLDEEFPAICQDILVWERVDSYRQVCGYNLTERREIFQTNGSFDHTLPSVSEGLVVFENSSEESDITILNAADGSEFLLAPDTGNSYQTEPDIWKNRVVWKDSRDYYYDIYLCTMGVSMPPLAPDFSANSTSGPGPLTVAFSDASSGTISGWSWDFGDGGISADRNPVHTYTIPGTYSVTLIVYNPYQRDYLTRTAYITVESPPIPEFSAYPLSGPAPLAVQFNDESLGYPGAWLWEFGDGENSTEQYPFHEYTMPGSYDVSLTAWNDHGNATLWRQDYIMVMEGICSSLNLPCEGIQTFWTDEGQCLLVDTSVFTSCTIGLIANDSILDVVPDQNTGISHLLFISDEEDAFSIDGNGTITGNFSMVEVISTDNSGDAGNLPPGCEGFYNFSFFLPEYPAGESLNAIFWEGCTPEDFSILDDTAWRHGFEDVIPAFTLLIDHQYISGDTPVNFTFGVDSDWIQEHGWRRPVLIDSNLEEAMVFIDSRFAGYTPLYVYSSLSEGNHTVVLVMAGYENVTGVFCPDEKKNSIRIFRIADDGSGDLLDTVFLYHDPGRNIDVFSAESPEGMSEFSVAATTQSGNPIQMIYLTLSRIIQDTTRPGSGGGGGYGGSGNTVGSTGSQAAAPTPVSEAGKEAAAEEPAAPAGDGAEVKKAPPMAVTSEATGDLGPSESTAPVPAKGQQYTEYGLFTLSLVKSLAVVFIALLVSLLFYLRWRRGGQKE